MNRRAWLCAGLLTVAIVVPLPRTPADAFRTTSATALPALEFGVNMHPLQNSYAVYPSAATLKLAASIGASVVRIDIQWGWLEYEGPDATTWDPVEKRRLDSFLAEAARLHIRVLATVLDTPCWASTDPGASCPVGTPHVDDTSPPRNPQTYAGFLQRLIAYAGTRIQYYEIWNEPDLPSTWSHPDPAAYARLLRTAYRAVKAANPRLQVLAGATSGADARFIRGVYAAGASGYFDALSIHPYTGSRSPEDCSSPRWSLRRGVESIHRLMLRYGDTHPIWLTEFGQSVSRRVTVKIQARYVRHALAAIRGWSYVRGALWYELYDDPMAQDGQLYGLFRGTLSPRPSARAFSSIAQRR